ncbi:MAG: hypothetical protein JW801_07605 [Bacteroidales bacterium]|nr:hypothetical protein [Bacteroidales bacterium]
MYRILAVFLHIFLALTIGGSFQSGITLDVKAPMQVSAGSEFEVIVDIGKGDLESFSRLQQSLPAGLTATPYISENADFTFDEKRVRLIWLRMPKEDKISIVYRIRVDQRLKGTFSIDSKFSYIDENERKSVTMISDPITIMPSPDIDPDLIVDINDFEDKVIPYIPGGTGETGMLCARQAPIKNASDGSYTVRLLVNKESRQKFAKIEEEIPAGYTAENIEPRESIFTFRNGTAKFLWMNLPSDQLFTVSYKLVPKKANAAPPVLKGKFSYLEGEKTTSLDILQTDMDLAAIEPSQLGVLINSLSTPALADNGTIKTNLQTTTGTTTNTNAQGNQNRETKTSSRKQSKVDQAYLLQPEGGIYYRVQVAAGHRSINIKKYFKKYKLDMEVKTEFHEGWHKYSIGSFPIYKDARDYRVHIWNTTDIDDAFVSAYNNGTRITVQEALMIANQTWYR